MIPSQQTAGSDEPGAEGRVGPRKVIALPGTFCSPLIFERLAELLDERFEMHALSWRTDATGSCPAWPIDPATHSATSSMRCAPPVECPTRRAGLTDAEIDELAGRGAA